MIVIITTVVSVVVCWRVRKIASASFHTQRNRAYGIALQNSAVTSLDTSQSTFMYYMYSYPMVDASDEIIQNGAQSTNIVTERNKAYGTRTTSCTEVYEEPLQCLEANVTDLTQVTTDRIEADCASVMEGEIETHTTPTTVEEGNQDSLEYCIISEENKVYCTAMSENNT